mmetsp:Transcript_16498/g.37276  ORF Transcript_16498/g.37276 Transcript_16498/m.37276 type:complete len:125 (-) Transcript_16498:211-585(-)
MSAWQAYVDPILGEGMASGAAICGLDGQVWASSNLTVEPDEVKAAMAGFADSNNLEKVSVGGVKYTFINRSEDKELHVKKGATGACIMKGETFVVFAWYEDSIAKGPCTSWTRKIVEDLVEKGY